MHVPRPLVLVPLLVAVASFGAACGGGDATATPTPTPTATATSTPTPEPTPTLAWPEVTTATIITDDLNVRSGPGADFVVVGRLQPDAEVPVAGQSTNGLWLGLPGIGWIAYREEWVDLPVAVTSLPEIPFDEIAYEFVGPPYPEGTLVDIPVVDEVVTAIVRGDRGSILRLAALTPEETATATPEVTPTPGVTPQSLGDRSKPEIACADGVLPASELEAHLDEFLTSEVVGEDVGLQLWAVVGEPQTDTLEAEFSVVLAFPGGEGRQVWVSPDGEGIEWFSLGCGPTAPSEMVRVIGGTPFWWFRPFLPEPLTPVE